MQNMPDECNLRPGDFKITERGMELCAFSPGSRLADIGCGDGETLRHLDYKYDIDIIGVDARPDCGLGGDNSGIIKSDAKKLPFSDSSMDGLIFECSMSLMELPDAVLNECNRVLKPGAKLMVSDLYARGEPAVLSGQLGRIERKDEILTRAAIFGFELLHFEDYSESLMELWATLVFENGSGNLYGGFCADAAALKRIKCGYFLAVFRKADGRISKIDRWTGVVTGYGRAISCKELRTWQINRIRETLDHAMAGEFYRNLLYGINIENIRRFDDFEKLPFSEARDLTRDYKRFLAVSPANVKRIVTMESSGTTGTGKRVCFTEGDLYRTEEFFTYALSDYVCSGHKAMVFMSGRAEDGLGDLLGRAFRRINVEACIFGGISDYNVAAEAACGFDFFVGYPAQMLRLCRTAPSLSPHGVLLSADYIPESVIAVLKKNWNCRIIRHFGMTETCFGCAADCVEEFGQHIRHGDFYVEIIDPKSGKTLDAGQNGEIVITTLRSEAIPLVRYRTGDMGYIDNGMCVCGGRLPRLGRVFGRIENHRTKLNIHSLDELMYSFEEVLDYEAELRGSLLKLRIEGGEIDCGRISREFDVTVSVEHGLKGNSKGKRKLVIPLT